MPKFKKGDIVKERSSKSLWRAIILEPSTDSNSYVQCIRTGDGKPPKPSMPHYEETNNLVLDINYLFNCDLEALLNG